MHAVILNSCLHCFRHDWRREWSPQTRDSARFIPLCEGRKRCLGSDAIRKRRRRFDQFFLRKGSELVYKRRPFFPASFEVDLRAFEHSLRRSEFKSVARRAQSGSGRRLWCQRICETKVAVSFSSSSFSPLSPSIQQILHSLGPVDPVSSILLARPPLATVPASLPPPSLSLLYQLVVHHPLCSPGVGQGLVSHQSHLFVTLNPSLLLATVSFSVRKNNKQPSGSSNRMSSVCSTIPGENTVYTSFSTATVTNLIVRPNHPPNSTLSARISSLPLSGLALFSLVRPDERRSRFNNLEFECCIRDSLRHINRVRFSQQHCTRLSHHSLVRARTDGRPSEFPSNPIAARGQRGGRRDL